MDISVSGNNRLPASFSCMPLISMPMTSYWSQYTYTPANVTLTAPAPVFDKNGTVIPPNMAQLIASATPDVILVVVFSNTTFASGAVVSSCQVPPSRVAVESNPNMRMNSKLSAATYYANGSTVSFSWTSSVGCNDHPPAMYWQLQAWGVRFSDLTGGFAARTGGNQALVQDLSVPVKFEYGSSSICPASTFKVSAAQGQNRGGRFGIVTISVMMIALLGL
ncbi:hypothetical protein BDR26DRAFT_848652 [Obelidium mucronatum]|nr:hypothetical protein BDR26DRAFT_848652 [Obelidium mucronatum]